MIKTWSYFLVSFVAYASESGLQILFQKVRLTFNYYCGEH